MVIRYRMRYNDYQKEVGRLKRRNFMRQIRIKEIEEPDFGCEGRPQGESVFVKIWAEDAGTGEEIVCRMEEKALWQSGIDEGMQVWMDER